MESKICTQCKIEKHMGAFYNKYTECIGCNCTGSSNRNYENKVKLSIQRKLYYGKIRETLKKQNDRYIIFKKIT